MRIIVESTSSKKSFVLCSSSQVLPTNSHLMENFDKLNIIWMLFAFQAAAYTSLIQRGLFTADPNIFPSEYYGSGEWASTALEAFKNLQPLLNSQDVSWAVFVKLLVENDARKVLLYLVLAHLFVKVPRPVDNELTFSVFKSNCHLLLPVKPLRGRGNPVKCLA